MYTDFNSLPTTSFPIQQDTKPTHKIYQLHQLVKQNDLVGFMNALREGLDIHEKDENKHTALFYAKDDCAKFKKFIQILNELKISLEIEVEPGKYVLDILFDFLAATPFFRDDLNYIFSLYTQRAEKYSYYFDGKIKHAYSYMAKLAIDSAKLTKIESIIRELSKTYSLDIELYSPHWSSLLYLYCDCLKAAPNISEGLKFIGFMIQHGAVFTYDIACQLFDTLNHLEENFSLDLVVDDKGTTLLHLFCQSKLKNDELCVFLESLAELTENDSNKKKYPHHRKVIAASYDRLDQHMRFPQQYLSADVWNNAPDSFTKIFLNQFSIKDNSLTDVFYHIWCLGKNVVQQLQYSSLLQQEAVFAHLANNQEVVTKNSNLMTFLCAHYIINNKSELSENFFTCCLRLDQNAQRNLMYIAIEHESLVFLIGMQKRVDILESKLANSSNVILEVTAAKDAMQKQIPINTATVKELEQYVRPYYDEMDTLNGLNQRIEKLHELCEDPETLLANAQECVDILKKQVTNEQAAPPSQEDVEKLIGLIEQLLQNRNNDIEDLKEFLESLKAQLLPNRKAFNECAIETQNKIDTLEKSVIELQAQCKEFGQTRKRKISLSDISQKLIQSINNFLELPRLQVKDLNKTINELGNQQEEIYPIINSYASNLKEEITLYEDSLKKIEEFTALKSNLEKNIDTLQSELIFLTSQLFQKKNLKKIIFQPYGNIILGTPETINISPYQHAQKHPEIAQWMSSLQ